MKGSRGSPVSLSVGVRTTVGALVLYEKWRRVVPSFIAE
jgi:hypothetical protein